MHFNYFAVDDTVIVGKGKDNIEEFEISGSIDIEKNTF